MPAIQVRNDELVDILLPDFQARAEPNFAWKSAVSALLALPALRGAWTMSSIRHVAASRVRDYSGQTNNLQENGNPVYGFENLVPYAEFDGVADYLSKADGGAGNWADIIGTEAYIVPAQRGLTIGGWFRFDAATAGFETLIGKRVGAGNLSYYLQRTDTGVGRFVVSVDGTATVLIDSIGTVMAATAWYHIVGRFDPSTEINIWINGVKFSNVAAIPASIFDGTALFSIGSTGGVANFWPGWASMCFLCAAALSDAIIGTLYQQTRSMFGR